MSGPPLLLRGDATRDIGLGHVARLVALAEAHPGAQAMFECDDALASWCAARGYPAGDWPDAEVFATARRLGAVVVVDGPALAARLVPRLLDEGVRVAVVDDRGAVPWQVDTIVNHNFHAPSLARSYRARQALLGRRYALLRSELRRWPRGACDPQPNRRPRIVITFGGSDPPGATARVLRLLPARPRLELDVVLGPGFREPADLPAVRHDVRVHRAPGDLAALVFGADAAIASAGGTLAELAYLGCQTFALAIVDDQVATASAQAAAGLVACGQDARTLPDGILATSIARFIEDAAWRLSLRAAALESIDGDGARRVTSALSAA